jgi:hypothetical protein
MWFITDTLVGKLFHYIYISLPGWGIWICGSITPVTGRVSRAQRRTRRPHFVGICCLAIVLNKETYYHLTGLYWLRYVKMLLQRPSEESTNQSYTCPERWCPGALCNFRKSQATTHVEVVKWLAHRCSQKKTLWTDWKTWIFLPPGIPECCKNWYCHDTNLIWTFG